MPEVISTLACASLLLFLLIAAAPALSLVRSTAASTQPGLSLFGIIEQIAILVFALAAASLTARNPAFPSTLPPPDPARSPSFSPEPAARSCHETPHDAFIDTACAQGLPCPIVL